MSPLEILSAVAALALIVGAIEGVRVPTSLRKVGGLWHWRVGAVGGAFYVAKGAK